MLELRQGRKKDCRRGEEEEGESREPQVPWRGAGAAPLPGPLRARTKKLAWKSAKI